MTQQQSSSEDRRLQPQDLGIGNCLSAETGVFDAGAKFTGHDDGRLFGRLVVGVWNPRRVDALDRDSRDFDGTAWLFADPATAHAVAATMRKAADEVDTAGRYMQERIDQLVAAEKRDKAGRVDYLRICTKLAHEQEEATAAYQAAHDREQADALHAAIMAAGQGAG
jgi:hypothetical protein